MCWYYGWGWGGWLAMSLMMLAFWGLVIGLIVWLIHTSSRPDKAPRPPQAEDILVERFARGEIDAAEYQEWLRILGGTPTGSPMRLDKVKVGR